LSAPRLLLLVLLTGALPVTLLRAQGDDYRTPRSGEAFSGSVFGSPIEIAARDRRSVASWAAILDTAAHAEGAGSQPAASVYFWEHPAEGKLLRAVVAIVYDDIFYARPIGSGAAEAVLTFSNYTLPFATNERVDGNFTHGEKLNWGYVRGGVGGGFRTSIGPAQDNMFAADLIVEPGLLYFGQSDSTSVNYEMPDSTFELRVHLKVRADRIERNLLELAHEGFAAGADAVYGNRAHWGDYGLPGVAFHSGDDGKQYFEGSAYVYGITAAPFLASDRHRVYASMYGGVGGDLDRFSAMRVGGGADMHGEEFETTAQPALPGAAIDEFYPLHYAIGTAGYRCELAFWSHVDVGATVAWLQRERLQGATRAPQDDTLTALSARLTSGFVGRTRLQLGYAYNFDVVRSGERGGQEVYVQLIGRF
jgi:hypothetical protein